MAEENAQEERLKLMQDGRVYPVGQVLRATYDAENHETLGNDVTHLMLNLARVPYEPLAARPAAVAPTPAARLGMLSRLGALFGLRAHQG